ncbi:MAG: HAMP domain-containing histidine kinase [Clostridia bacterium]|nr:HAMP domain-containing histidine kinase [Clostridia bacterium]
MFKSLFTKYISVFMLILLLSFLILTSILSTLVVAYNTDVKMNSMADAAYSVSVYVQQNYLSSGQSDFGDYLQTHSTWVMPVIDLLSVNVDNMILWLVDADGEIVLTGGSGLSQLEESVMPTEGGRYELPAAVCEKLKQEGYVSGNGTLEGFFRSGHCTYGIAIENEAGQFLGAVMASTSSAGMNELLEAMNKTVLMSTLWIMLAALVAVYFITERMVSPLRSMSRAAKSFARGKFDVRVPVTGSDEIAELAEAFNNMAESLAAQDEMQRSFVANVSHDLRTPMTTIAGFIDGIIDGAIPADKHEYYLGVISGEVRRLSRLVTALLDISRMQAGERKFTMASFDICELARQILISFEQKIEEKKLEVSFECDSDRMDVWADRDAIHQVLYNICDNAIKFAYDGGKYAVTITEKDKKITVSVFNNGNGIPEADLPHIFDRFYKSDKSRGLDKTGVGLGMYISRTIIEAHGENIWVESVYGEWCRFSFTLAKAPQRAVFTGREERSVKVQEKNGE